MDKDTPTRKPFFGDISPFRGVNALLTLCGVANLSAGAHACLIERPPIWSFGLALGVISFAQFSCVSSPAQKSPLFETDLAQRKWTKSICAGVITSDALFIGASSLKLFGDARLHTMPARIAPGLEICALLWCFSVLHSQNLSAPG